MPDKYKAEAWDELKKWLESIRKHDPSLKKFADMILGGMRDILDSRTGVEQLEAK